MRFLHKYLLFLILLMSIVSVAEWSSIPLGNYFISLTVNVLIIAYLIGYINKHKGLFWSKDYIIVTIYLLWLVIGIIRGIFVADNYWEFKALLTASMSLSLPLYMYVFRDPVVVQRIMSYWVKWGIICFFVLIIWILPPSGFSFYLGPVLSLACFIPIIPFKWKWLFLTLLLIMIVADIDARSQIIKSMLALFISLMYILSKKISLKILGFIHWSLYIGAVAFLILGISGVFNVFQDTNDKYEGKYIENKNVKGDETTIDASSDTRSFIYVEVISSALKHNYVLLGRTPARGNDSESFGSFSAEELHTGKYERDSNEVCFPNVFTWLGLVGMLLYCAIYVCASWKALYRSNSVFLKLIGIFIAFHFAYGWVEDFDDFNIFNLSLWMMIAMGYSKYFRSTSDSQFKAFIRGLFIHK